MHLFSAMDMMRRRSEPGLSSEANDAEENRGDRGEDRQQAPEVQALTDGREIARVQPIAQIEGEMVQGPQRILSGASGLMRK